jgi:hypothetical protein
MDTTVFSFTLRKNAKRAAEAIYPALDNFRLSRVSAVITGHRGATDARGIRRCICPISPAFPQSRSVLHRSRRVVRGWDADREPDLANDRPLSGVRWRRWLGRSWRVLAPPLFASTGVKHASSPLRFPQWPLPLEPRGPCQSPVTAEMIAAGLPSLRLGWWWDRDATIAKGLDNRARCLFSHPAAVFRRNGDEVRPSPFKAPPSTPDASRTGHSWIPSCQPVPTIPLLLLREGGKRLAGVHPPR